jgi:gluconokinase
VSVQRYVVMGVSGCGKTSIGRGLAAALEADFIDGDDLHPQANVTKMARGVPLTDEDRAPWLAVVAQRLASASVTTIIGCSALRRRYRDWIRADAGPDVVFLHLSGSRDLIASRMAVREGHFMPLSLLDSQFAALEPPGADERSITVNIDQPEQEIVAEFLAEISGL